MPLIARGDTTATVLTNHGTGTACADPTNQTSDVCSGDVLAVGVGVVTIGDAMTSHISPDAVPPCTPHAPLLDTSSDNVFANGKLVGRLTDTYDGQTILSHTITDVAQSTVYANG